MILAMINRNLNPSPKIRKAIYVFTAVASPLVAYLGQENVIDPFWLGLFLVLNTAVVGLAGLNVSPEEGEK